MIKLVPSNAILHENLILFLDINISGIFAYDLNKDELMLKWIAPEESVTKRSLFSNIHIWKDNLILVPYNANYIWIVELNFINYRKIELNNNYEQKFGASIVIDNNLYMFKHNYPKSLRVNLEDSDIYEMNLDPIDFFTSAMLYQGRIICPSCSRNIFYEIDVETLNSEIHSLGADNEIYGMVSEIDGDLYFFPRKGKHVVIKKGDEEETLVELPKDSSFKKGFKFDDNIYIPSLFKNESCMIQNQKGTVWEVKGGFANSFKLARYKYCVMSYAGDVTVYNIEKKQIYYYMFEMTENEYMKMAKKMGVSCKESILENKNIGLNFWIEYVKNL